METNYQRWCRVYTENLKRNMAKHPADYMPGLDPEIVAAKMCAATLAGSANKDSPTFRQTCKHFGIPHTYKAIAAFLHEGISQ